MLKSKRNLKVTGRLVRVDSSREDEGEAGLIY